MLIKIRRNLAIMTNVLDLILQFLQCKKPSCNSVQILKRILALLVKNRAILAKKRQELLVGIRYAIYLVEPALLWQRRKALFLQSALEVVCRLLEEYISVGFLVGGVGCQSWRYYVGSYTTHSLNSL